MIILLSHLIDIKLFEIHDIYIKKENIFKIEDEILYFRVKNWFLLQIISFYNRYRVFNSIFTKKNIPLTKKNKNLFI